MSQVIKLRLSNPVEPGAAPLNCEALADTGAMHLCVPEHVARQLGLSLTSQEPREVTLADGSKRSVPYVGPIRVQFENRTCFVGGLIPAPQG